MPLSCNDKFQKLAGFAVVIKVRKNKGQDDTSLCFLHIFFNRVFFSRENIGSIYDRSELFPAS